EPTVGVYDGRAVAIRMHPLTMHDKVRYSGSIARGRLELFHRFSRRIELRWQLLDLLHRVGSGIERPQTGRLQKSGDREKCAIAVRTRIHNSDGQIVRELQRRLLPPAVALWPINKRTSSNVIENGHHERVPCGGGGLETLFGSGLVDEGHPWMPRV